MTSNSLEERICMGNRPEFVAWHKTDYSLGDNNIYQGQIFFFKYNFGASYSCLLLTTSSYITQQIITTSYADNINTIFILIRVIIKEFSINRCLMMIKTVDPEIKYIIRDIFVIILISRALAHYVTACKLLLQYKTNVAINVPPRLGY